jgi:RNA polymerase sigma-70 factor (ECF subfamily)
VEGTDAILSREQERSVARAFTRLVDRLHGRVYDYLCWLSRDAALAADLTDETFLRLWRRPPDPCRPLSHRAYVFKVALNLYREHLRRTGIEWAPLDETADELPDPSPQPFARLTQDEMQRAVRAAVLSLPELQRAVIVLHNLEGLTLREVAEALDMPVGTAKSRLSSGFAMLRRALREWKEDGNDLH